MKFKSKLYFCPLTAYAVFYHETRDPFSKLLGKKRTMINNLNNSEQKMYIY